MNKFFLCVLVVAAAVPALAQDDGERLPAPGAEAPDDFADDEGGADPAATDGPEDAAATDEPAPRDEDAPPRKARDRDADEYDDDRASDRRRRRDRAPASDVEELGFFDRHFTFSLNDNLEPEIEENLAVIWVASVLLTTPISVFGMIWAPVAFGAGSPDGDYWLDAIVHHLASSLGRACISGCFPLSLAWLIYLEPVQMINMYDYHLKRKRAARGERTARAQVPGPVRTAQAEAHAY